MTLAERRAERIWRKTSARAVEVATQAQNARQRGKHARANQLMRQSSRLFEEAIFWRGQIPQTRLWAIDSELLAKARES